MKNVNVNSEMDKQNGNRINLKFSWIIFVWLLMIILDILTLIVFFNYQHINVLVINVMIKIMPFFPLFLIIMIFQIKKIGNELIRKHSLLTFLILSCFFPEIFLLIFYFSLTKAWKEYSTNPKYAFALKISKGIIDQNQPKQVENHYNVEKYKNIDEKLKKLDDFRAQGIINDQEYNKIKEEIIKTSIN